MTPDTCCNHNCDEGRTCPLRHGYPTSRRYPRTMAEAFPQVRASAGVYYPRPGLAARVLRLLRGALRV